MAPYITYSTIVNNYNVLQYTCVQCYVTMFNYHTCLNRSKQKQYCNGTIQIVYPHMPLNLIHLNLLCLYYFVLGVT